MERLLALVDGKKVHAVIVAKLNPPTRSVKDLCELLERFERCGVGPNFGGGVPRHQFCRSPPSVEHHDRGEPMGAGGRRRAHPGHFCCMTARRCTESVKCSPPLSP